MVGCRRCVPRSVRGGGACGHVFLILTVPVFIRSLSWCHDFFVGYKMRKNDVSAPSAKSSSHSDAPSGNAQEVVQNAGPTLSSPHMDILYVATAIETQRQSKQALTSTSQSHLPVQDSRNDGCTHKTRNSSVLTSARSSQPVSAASNKEGGGGGSHWHQLRRAAPRRREFRWQFLVAAGESVPRRLGTRGDRQQLSCPV